MVDSELAQDLPEVWDWEIVQDDWWKTSFRAISWAYKTKPDHPRPPHYHDLLARGRRRKIVSDVQNLSRSAQVDVNLNTGLSGVRAAEDALKRYEVEVAILPSTPPPCDQDDRSPCFEHSLERDVWYEKVRELFGGILEEGSLPEVDSLSPDVPLWDLDNLEDSPPSSSFSLVAAHSEASVECNPPLSTPKPKTALSYAGAVSGGAITNSPTVLSPLPSKALSKAALPFIPATPIRPPSRDPTTPPLTSSSGSSDSPYSSPTYNFHFPSLNTVSPTDRKETRSLPISLQKDESGFYIEVLEDAIPATTQSLNGTRSGTPRRPSTALFPSFLVDGSPSSRSSRGSRKSTREMVDEVRSSGRKTRRSGRRQTSSKDADLASLLSEAPSAKSDDSTDMWISTVVVSEGSSHQPIVTDDGWILQSNAQMSLPASQPKHKHGHKRSSASASTTHSTSPRSSTFSPASSTMSLTVPHTPATVSSQLPPMPQLYSPPSAVPYTPYASSYATTSPAAFMHMQYPSARAPWPMGYQPGMYPVYQPFGVMPAAMPYRMIPIAPLQPSTMFYDGHGKGKPGGAMAQ